MLLGDLGLGLPQLRDDVAVGEASHELALLDLHALPDIDLRDEALDLGSNFGVPGWQHPELPRHPQLDLHEHRADERSCQDCEHHPSVSLRRRLDRLAIGPGGRRSPEWEASQPIAEAHAEERQEHEQSPRLKAGDEAAQPYRDEPQGAKRVEDGERAVREIDPALPGADRCRLLGLSTEAREASPDIVEGPLAQVRHAEPIAQEVVAVELQQRIEIQEDLEPRRRQDDQGDRVREAVGCRDPPREHGEGPQHQLQVRPGQCDDQPLRLLREEPGIAHVAVERGVEVDEEDPHVMNLAAVPLAGEPVGELVNGAHDDHEHPNHQKRPHAEQADEAMVDLANVGREGHRRQNDDRE